MPWNDPIRATNKAEARAKIEVSIYLDQRCLKGKWPLKMSLNSKDNHTDKKTLQAKERPTVRPNKGLRSPKGPRRPRRIERKKRRTKERGEGNEKVAPRPQG